MSCRLRNKSSFPTERSRHFCCGHLGQGTRSVYSLSDDIGVVASVDFEAAVVRPQIDGDGNACNASFIDLEENQHRANS